MSVDVGPPEGSFPDETKQKQDYDNIILLKTHKYNRYSGNLYFKCLEDKNIIGWTDLCVASVTLVSFGPLGLSAPHMHVCIIHK